MNSEKSTHSRNEPDQEPQGPVEPTPEADLEQLEQKEASGLRGLLKLPENAHKKDIIPKLKEEYYSLKNNGNRTQKEDIKFFEIEKLYRRIFRGGGTQKEKNARLDKILEEEKQKAQEAKEKAEKVEGGLEENKEFNPSEILEILGLKDEKNLSVGDFLDAVVNYITENEGTENRETKIIDSFMQ